MGAQSGASAAVPAESGRRLHLSIALRWGDLDAYGHVNNASLLKILEEARIRALWRGEPGEEVPGTAVLDGSADGPVQSLIARQEIEYLAPVPYLRAPLDVPLWFGKLGGSSFEICYEVRSPRGSAESLLYARASTTLVLVAADTGRPVRLTPEMRGAWAPYAGEPLVFGRR